MSRQSSPPSPLAFLVTAAGCGSRMGGGEKKEYRKLGSRSVLETTVLAMIDAGIFDFGVITCPVGKIDTTKEILSPIDSLISDSGISILYCEGGAERQDSVLNGLEKLNTHHPETAAVLIHDGARPWVSPAVIRSVAQALTGAGGAAPVVPSVDAMKQIDGSGIITHHLPRRETVSVQTPQGFRFREILQAHRKASTDGRKYIDDTEIFSRYAGEVTTVAGETANKKITYAEDLG